MRGETIRLPAETTENALLAQVDRLNADPNVHGILVQMPLPRHIAADKVIRRIRPEKDVDGFHPVNVGKLSIGERDGFVPCTPAGPRSSRLAPAAGMRVAVASRSGTARPKRLPPEAMCIPRTPITVPAATA